MGKESRTHKNEKSREERRKQVIEPVVHYVHVWPALLIWERKDMAEQTAVQCSLDANAKKTCFCKEQVHPCTRIETSAKTHAEELQEGEGGKP